MTDDPSAPEAVPMQFAIQLPPEAEAGTYADFASIWHTPNAFVLDFIAAKRPPMPQVNESGQVVASVLEAKIVTRVRIPAEQVAPIVQALQAQLDAWVVETGRAAPPESWLFPGQPDEA